MVIGVAVFVIAILIVAIWMIIEMKRLKHKMFAVFLIGTILFVYLSFNFVTRGHDVNLKTASGVFEAGKLYFSWLGSAFGNMKSITTNAIKMDWGTNETVGK